jgi:hypothetical protein
LLKSMIWTQYPMLNQRWTLQKCLSKIYSENRISAKNYFRKLPQTPDFHCLYVYLKNWQFLRLGVWKFLLTTFCCYNPQISNLIFIDVRITIFCNFCRTKPGWPDEFVRESSKM